MIRIYHISHCHHPAKDFSFLSFQSTACSINTKIKKMMNIHSCQISIHERVRLESTFPQPIYTQLVMFTFVTIVKHALENNYLGHLQITASTTLHVVLREEKRREGRGRMNNESIMGEKVDWKEIERDYKECKKKERD